MKQEMTFSMEVRIKSEAKFLQSVATALDKMRQSISESPEFDADRGDALLCSYKFIARGEDK